MEYISAILGHVVPIISEASKSQFGLMSLIALIALAIVLLFLYLTARTRPVLSFVLALVAILLMFGGVVGLVLSVDVRKPAIVYDVDMLQRLQAVGFKIPHLEDATSTDYELLDGMLQRQPDGTWHERQEQPRGREVLYEYKQTNVTAGKIDYSTAQDLLAGECSGHGRRRIPLSLRRGELRLRGSVHLDARGLDDLAPLLDFAGNVGPELGGSHRHRLRAQTRKLRLYHRIQEHGVDLFVEQFDDFRRRLCGRADRVPNIGLVARHEFRRSGDVRQRGRARRAGHRQRPQLARFDVLHRLQYGSERRLHLPAEQIRQVTAAIGNVHQVDAGHLFE